MNTAPERMPEDPSSFELNSEASCFMLITGCFTAPELILRGISKLKQFTHVLTDPYNTLGPDA